MRRGQHRPDERPHRLLVRAARTQRVEERQRLAAQPERLRLHAFRRVDGAPAQPPFEEVDVVAAETRVRRAHEPVEVVAAAAEPGEAQQREQRAAERRLAEPRRALGRVRDAEPGERRLERRAPALERWRDDRDVSRVRAAADELEDLLAHELEHAARTRCLEEAHRSLEGRSGRVTVDEQPPLEMRERGPHVAIGCGGELLDAPRGLLGQRLRRPLERGEREAPGLVRERDGDVGAGREPFDERPLRRGEILESVGVHGTAVPRVEIAGHAVGGVAPLAIAVPAPEPFQLRAVRTEQVGELWHRGLPARRAPTRAPRAWPPASPRSPRSAMCPARYASAAARAGRPRAPHGGRRCRGRCRRTGRRTCPQSRRRAPSRPRRDRAARAEPPPGSGRRAPARARCPPHSGRAGGRPCRRSRAPRAVSAARHPV